MSKGFGAKDTKKKKNVKQIFLEKEFILGEKYYFDKNYSKAESIFLELKNKGYENPNLILYLANIYISFKSYEKAIKLLKKVLELNPNNPDLYFNLGSIYFLKKEYNFSISYYLQSIKFDPENSFSYKNIAMSSVSCTASKKTSTKYHNL